MIFYNAKDIFIQRRPTIGNGFEEYVFTSTPNNVVVFDNNSNLTSIDYLTLANTLSPLLTSTSQSTSASYAIFAETSATSSFMSFNGNRPIKRSGYSGLNVGGIDVDDFLNNFFFPFVSATVSISGGGLYETGSLQTV